MFTYIIAFICYTLAMIGILLIGFVIYKKTIITNKSESKNIIKILDCTQIAPKKNLLVIRVKNEKFLIASGAEHTTFLAKLENDNTDNNAKNQEQKQDKIQKQFKELYSNQELSQIPDRKEMIRKLLKDLNDTPQTRIEGRY